MPCGKYPAAYNTPADVDLNCGWDFDITASFIYWYVNQDGMDTAHILPTVSAVGLPSTPGAVAYHSFKYSPGFKVGFGFDTGYDNWNGSAEYTWLHRKNSSSSTIPAAAGTAWVHNDWFTTLTANNGFNQAGNAFVVTSATPVVKSKWKMHYDNVEVLFSRPYYQGTCLTILPTGGLRAAWIRQGFTIDFVNPLGAVIGSSFNTSHSWSIGPKAGVISHWLLGSGFRFEGMAAGSLLYTRYTKVKHSEQDFQPRQGYSLSRRNLNAVRPVAEMGLGLGWGTYFADNQFFFDLSARYDFNIFWEQNVMREFVSNIAGFEDDIGSLFMHGLTVNVRFDF